MTNLLTIFYTVMFVVVILTGVSYVGSESITNNPNLDSKSLEIINQTNAELVAKYDKDEFLIEDNNVTANSSFADVDPFARQYLEDKSEIEQKQTTLQKALGMPDLILISLGIEQNELLLIIKGFIVALISFIIGLAIYIAIRTGEVKD